MVAGPGHRHPEQEEEAQFPPYGETLEKEGIGHSEAGEELEAHGAGFLGMRPWLHAQSRPKLVACSPVTLLNI